MDKTNYRAPDAAQSGANDEWMREPRASKHVNLAGSTMAKMRLRGDGPPYSKAGRAVIYRRSDLDRWLASLRRQNTSQRTPGAA